MRSTLVLLATASLLLGACKKNSVDTIDVCGGNPGPLPAGYKVRLSIGGTAPNVSLLLRDNQRYSCTNYTLHTGLLSTGNKLALTTCDAAQGGVCATGTGPATGTIALGPYLGSSYTFDVNIRGQRTTGTIDLRTAGAYTIQLADTTYASVR